MANPNPTPRLENLTNAGKGRPKKGRQSVKITLPPAVLEALLEVQGLQFWDRSEAIEHCVRMAIGCDPHFDESDFDLIRQGRGVE